MNSKEKIETFRAVTRVTRSEAAQTQPMFETTWRAKWLADGAKTIEEMAEALESEAARLRELAAAGVELADEVEDDYASLTTTDADVAVENLVADLARLAEAFLEVRLEAFEIQIVAGVDGGAVFVILGVRHF